MHNTLAEQLTGEKSILGKSSLPTGSEITLSTAPDQSHTACGMKAVLEQIGSGFGIFVGAKTFFPLPTVNWGTRGGGGTF